MYEMKKMIYMVMALASLSYSTQTMAQSQGLQKKVNAYFLQSLKACLLYTSDAADDAFRV